jgi:hypothetical protein
MDLDMIGMKLAAAVLSAVLASASSAAAYGDVTLTECPPEAAAGDYQRGYDTGQEDGYAAGLTDGRNDKCDEIAAHSPQIADALKSAGIC